MKAVLKVEIGRNKFVETGSIVKKRAPEQPQASQA